MQCDHNYLPLLSGHLDGSNSEAEEKRLEKHLKSCRHCRGLLQSMEENDLLLTQSIAAPPADLTARIMRAVEQEPKKKSSRKRYYFSTAVAGLAAAAVLCFGQQGDNLPLLPETANDRSQEAYSLDSAEETADFTEAEDQVKSGEFVITEEPYEDFAGSASEASMDGVCYSQDSTPADTAPLETQPDSVQDETFSENTEPITQTEPPSEPIVQSESPTEPTAQTEPPSEPIVQSEPPSESTAQTEPPTEPMTQPETSTETFSLPPLEVEPSGKAPASIISGNGEIAYRPPISGKEQQEPAVPTLVIWDATSGNLLLPFGAQKTEFAVQRAGDSSSLYHQFASALSLLRKPTSLNSKLFSPMFTSEVYSISYDELRALFDSCLQKYELAFYFPKEIQNLDHCQLILIDAPKGSLAVTSGKTNE